MDSNIFNGGFVLIVLWATVKQQQKKLIRKRRCCRKGKKSLLTAKQVKVQKLDQSIVSSNSRSAAHKHKILYWSFSFPKSDHEFDHQSDHEI